MSVRARLAVAYVAAMAVALTIVGVIVFWQFGQSLRATLDEGLRTRAINAASQLEADAQVGLQEGDAAAPGTFLAVFDTRGNLVDATASAPKGISLAGTNAGAGELRIGSAAYATYLQSAGSYRVLAGANLQGILSDQDQLRRLLALAGVLAGCVSLAGGWWLAARALRPVALITEEAASIEPTDLSRRLPGADRSDELGRLAQTLNDMFGRVEDSVRRQRAFVASASHDLRTPIAAIRAELELADRPGARARELHAALQAALGDVVRLADLANGLLELASVEVDGRPLSLRSVSLRAVVGASVDRVASVARQRSIRMRISAPGDEVLVDQFRFEQALTNILANALRFTDDGGEVEIAASVTAAGNAERTMLVEVLDRGPGVPSGDLEFLFLPFRRGRSSSGSGLGLATARAAMRAQNGEVGYEPRSGGGSRFWLRMRVGPLRVLPRALPDRGIGHEISPS